jgi:hypothetical protein
MVVVHTVLYAQCVGALSYLWWTSLIDKLMYGHTYLYAHTKYLHVYFPHVPPLSTIANHIWRVLPCYRQVCVLFTFTPIPPDSAPD